MRERLTILLFLVAASGLASCGGEDDDEGLAPGDTLAELALPPSAGAPRATLPGGGPDTLDAEESVVTPPVEPGPGEPITPPPVLDVGAIANAYRRFYQEQFAEMGSTVRGSVDPEIVEEAKRRTALDYAYVEVSAWNDLLSDLDGSQRAELAQRIAAANRDLARELHGAAP